ncbi:MAG: enoyl-CoA hydratase-related protein, partial [Candidatus Binataceae bacterium]
MSYETILLEKTDGIVRLTLNRPERANTISAQLANDVVAAMDEVEADSTSRVVILTGAGRHFCGGADLRDPARRGRT